MDKLENLRKIAKEEKIPIIDSESERFLGKFLKENRPQSILELGTAIGYSSIFFASSTDSVKSIVSVEKNMQMAERAQRNIEEFNIQNIRVYCADALEFLESHNKKYDFIFIDAAKGHYREFLDKCVNLLNENGAIICDNVLFRGMISDDAKVKRRKITIVRRMRKFLNELQNDDRFITKLYEIGDGLLLIRRT